MDTCPGKFNTEEELEEFISRPGKEVLELFRRIDGDVVFLGVSGKIGPCLARMAKRACDEAGVKKNIIGVSQFSESGQQEKLEHRGIKTIKGDLLDPDFLKRLPAAENVFFLAGIKFGSVENLPLTWAVNSYLPAMVARHFSSSRIVAFSTGCVYPMVPVNSGGSVESDTPVAVGEYAQSCLGRERMFQYGSRKHNTRAVIIRLNYSVETRYGVLVDIALKVKTGKPVDLTTGHFNVIWQGDVNDYVLRSLELAESPARILNITGPDTLSVRETALRFGQHFGKEPRFINSEAPTSLLNNAGEAHSLFGKPRIYPEQIIKWIAEWLKEDKKLLDKPTHFEVRDGIY